jgi:hypothetical protein
VKKIVSVLAICFFVLTYVTIAGFTPSIYAEQLFIAEETESESESDLWETEMDDEGIGSQATEEGEEESEDSGMPDWDLE